MITRSNYEIYFLDYFDGKLDQSGQKELFDFLGANTDLQDEFNRFTKMSAIPEFTIRFPGKEKLKKSIITINNYKSWLVRYAENDLQKTDKRAVELFLSNHPSAKTELELLNQSRFVPDHRIIFDRKNLLHKGGKVIFFKKSFNKIASAAAAIVLMLLAYNFIRDNNNEQKFVVENPEIQIKEEKESDNKIIENSKIESKKPVNQEKALHAEKFAKEEIVLNSEKEESRYHFPQSPIQSTEDPEELSMSSSSCENFEGPLPVLSNETTYVHASQSPEWNNPNDSIKNTDPNYIEHHDQAGLRSSLIAVNVKPETINYHYNTGQINIPQIRLQQNKLKEFDISEIFNDEDFKELELMQKEKMAAASKESQTLLDAAAEKFLELSRSANILLDKKQNDAENSITYSAGFGERFTLSHTRAR
jgi:hypothetical protein